MTVAGQPIREKGHVLFMVSDFAPLPSVGRLRIERFCRHLPSQGWKASVLTYHPPRGHAVDSALVAGIPHDTCVHRVHCPQPFDAPLYWGKRLITGRHHGAAERRKCRSDGILDTSHREGSIAGDADRRSVAGAMVTSFDRTKRWLNRHVLIPDEGIGAVMAMARAATKIIREYHVDVMVASVPAFTPWLSAVRAGNKTGCPVIVDYRDLWSEDVLREWIGPIRAGMERVMERWALRHSAAVITVTRSKTEFVRSLNACRVGTPFHSIYNGSDPDEKCAASESCNHSDAHHLMMLYTGRLYGQRRIDPLVEAIGRATQGVHIPKDLIRLRLAGTISGDQRGRLDAIIGRYGLHDAVHFLDYVTRSEVKALQRQADVNIVVVDEGRQSAGVVPGKLAEYFAAERFVLGICPTGETSRLIEAYGNGAWAPQADGTSLQKIVQRVADDFGRSPEGFRSRRGLPVLPDAPAASAQLAAILEDVVYRTAMSSAGHLSPKGEADLAMVKGAFV